MTTPDTPPPGPPPQPAVFHRVHLPDGGTLDISAPVLTAPLRADPAAGDVPAPVAATVGTVAFLRCHSDGAEQDLTAGEVSSLVSRFRLSLPAWAGAVARAQRVLE